MLFEWNKPLTYEEVLQQASSFLRESNHSSFVADWLMRERLDWTKTDLVMNYRNTMPTEQLVQFEQDFQAFLNGLPMQQIIGHEWFYDRKFKVTKDTLIPRPETEEWLDQVFSILPKEPLVVVDIGTGTGVLGLTMKLERPETKVTLTDISEGALAVAKENAEALGADVTFKQGDLLEPLKGETFDVVLCNPPYISADEVAVMDQSVLDHEPQGALFADDEGLAIYKRLAASLKDYLNPQARLFLEIGYRQGESVSALFKEAFPNAAVTVWKDFNQNDRVVAVYL